MNLIDVIQGKPFDSAIAEKHAEQFRASLEFIEAAYSFERVKFDFLTEHDASELYYGYEFLGDAILDATGRPVTVVMRYLNGHDFVPPYDFRDFGTWDDATDALADDVGQLGRLLTYILASRGLADVDPALGQKVVELLFRVQHTLEASYDLAA